jgi:hypothetical protein
VSGPFNPLNTVSPTDELRIRSKGTEYTSTVSSLRTLPMIVDTDGSTVTFDLSLGLWHQVTLGGNRALVLANVGVGQQFTVAVVQDATGSRTVSSWFNGFTVKWAGGSAPTLTTTAGKTDVMTFKVVSPTVIWGFVAGQNI